jgi:sugar (pentulose or hexulose) kinase
LSGYLTHRLVGKYIDSIGCQVGYIPFDYKKLNWAGKFDWKWQAVPMDPAFLPELVSPADLLGEISPEAAQATGIPVGLPLLAAAADKACEVIGAGCLQPHIACLSAGTTATINTTHHKYIEVIPLIPPYPSAVPGAYSLEIQVFRGYWMITWFLKEFGLYEQFRARDLAVEPETLFDELIRDIPAGSQGLTLQPFWSPGIKVPGPEARGAVIGFSDVHTRAHLFRAILEGLAYALREGAERTARRSGTAITELRMAGGGSQSQAAMQITADVFGLPVSRTSIYEASGLGAAIDAAVGLNLYPDFQSAVAGMSHCGETFEPNPETQPKYEEIYHRIYKKMYSRLRPLYEGIKNINNPQPG